MDQKIWQNMTPDVSLWTKRASSACNFYKLWPKCGTGGLSVAASWLARLAAFMSSASAFLYQTRSNNNNSNNNNNNNNNNNKGNVCGYTGTTLCVVGTGLLHGRDRVIQIWSGRQPDYDLLFWWPIFYLIGKNSVINKEDRLDVLGSSRFDPIGPELIQLEELRSSRIDSIGHPISSNLTQNPTSPPSRSKYRWQLWYGLVCEGGCFPDMSSGCYHRVASHKSW